MDNIAIKIENVSKEYRLGAIGGGTLRGDLQTLWANIRHKEDPNTKIGDAEKGKKGDRFMALNNVSFEVKKGEAVGIIGHNGAGKSTLLKLLSRVTAPSGGKISFNGRIASMLEVGTGFHPELTGRENVYMNGAILGMTKAEIEKKFDEIVEFSEVGQFIDTPVKRYSSGMKVKLAFDYRADVANGAESQAHAAPVGYIHWDGGAAFSFTTEWKHFEKIIVINSTVSPSGNFQTFAWNLDVGAPEAPVNKYYFDNVFFAIEESGNTIPLTPQEKKDTLTGAMDNWIKGMMEVTAEKVSAWDVVNEAISGVDGNGDGYYDLQSAVNGDPANNFYWQDYLGDEEYVRFVVAKARQYYAEFGGTAPLRLFINDYNLESDWDDNKKLKSLIHWIEVWESDGKTKIDGIGTQMHVSCYENPQTQASKEEHVVKMLELMAATGKLVKISELDMGYVDANGQTVPTTSMTEAQHKAMAAYYTFIVSKDFESIPAAQQYGITQWCITDASGELGTGWRGGEPVGLWDQNYSRKHAYAGFAEGLKGNN